MALSGKDRDQLLTILQEERDEFEEQVFEMLFGADARPTKTVEEYGEAIPRVFSYEDARDALEEASKSLQLLHMIKEHFACPSEEEDTEENWKMRELIDRLTRELN